MQRKAFICPSWHKHRHTQVSDSNRIHCLISFLVSAVAVFFPSYSETDCDCERVNNMNIEWYMAYGHAAADDECEKRIKITSILWYVVFKHLIQYIWLNGCNKSTHTHWQELGNTYFSPFFIVCHSKLFPCCRRVPDSLFRGTPDCVWFPHQFNNMHCWMDTKLYTEINQMICVMLLMPTKCKRVRARTHLYFQERVCVGAQMVSRSLSLLSARPILCSTFRMNDTQNLCISPDKESESTDLLK